MSCHVRERERERERERREREREREEREREREREREMLHQIRVRGPPKACMWLSTSSSGSEAAFLWRLIIGLASRPQAWQGQGGGRGGGGGGGGMEGEGQCKWGCNAATEPLKATSLVLVRFPESCMQPAKSMQHSLAAVNGCCIQILLCVVVGGKGGGGS